MLEVKSCLRSEVILVGHGHCEKPKASCPSNPMLLRQLLYSHLQSCDDHMVVPNGFVVNLLWVDLESELGCTFILISKVRAWHDAGKICDFVGDCLGGAQ